MSKTGNTKKVAEAIYDDINGEKEIKEVKDVKSLEGYDLTFVGFPIHVYGPDKKTKEFLEKQCRGKKLLCLLHTHLLKIMKHFRDTLKNLRKLLPIQTW
jgi:menaquinone-dependent protoporphyrinogen IX oxidase